MDILVLITTPDFAGINIKEQLLGIAGAQSQGNAENTNYQEGYQELKIQFEDFPIFYKKTQSNNIYLATTNTRCVYCENYDSKITHSLRQNGILAEPRLIIFPTTHRSEKNMPALCVHTPGNWGNAELGGKPSTLCYSNPQTQRFVWETLKEILNETLNGTNGTLKKFNNQFKLNNQFNSQLDNQSNNNHNQNNNYNQNKNQNNDPNNNFIEYDVTMECTHHGPLLGIPALFVEIGSDENAWKDKNAAGIIANALNVLFNSNLEKIEKRYVPAFGIGGPHYIPNFMRLMDGNGGDKNNKNDKKNDKNNESNISCYAFGHICPKYALEYLNKGMIIQAMQKSGAKKAVLDWKGLGGRKQEIARLLQELKVEHIKI